MKCQYCGNTLNIEDKFCRACGRPNPLAKQHQRDMENYKKQYEKTREDVIQKTKSFTSITVPVVILMVLLVITVAAGIFRARAWDIGYDLSNGRLNANADTYRSAVDEYIAKEDYIGLAEYWNVNNLYSIDSMNEYSAVANAAGQYERIFEDLTADHYQVYRTRENTISYVCDELDRLFDIENDYTYDSDIYLSGDKGEAINKIRQKTMTMISAVCGITYEEAESLAEMSSARQRAFLTERWGEDEE